LSNQEKPCYRFGQFLLCPSGLLLRDDSPVHLQPKAFDVLLVLVKNAGHIVTKEDLMKEVWPNTFVEDSSLTGCIKSVRKALGDPPEEHKYIETIPKRGYRFVALVDFPAEAIVVSPGLPDHSRDEVSPTRIKGEALISTHQVAADMIPNKKSDGEEESLAEAQNTSFPPLLPDQSDDGESPAETEDSVSTIASPIVAEAILDEQSDERLAVQTEDHHPPLAPPVVENVPITEDGMRPVEAIGKDEIEAPPPEPEAAANLPLSPGQSRGEESLAQNEIAASPAALPAAGTAAIDENSNEPLPIPSQIDSNPPKPEPPGVKDAPLTDTKVIIAILLICVALMVLSSIYGTANTWIEKFAPFGQFLVILYAVIYTERGPKSLGSIEPLEEEKIRSNSGYDNKQDWDKAKEIAETALKDYRRYWYGLLTSWYLLYLVLALLWRHSPDQQAISPTVATLQIFATLFNNCNSLMCALCYIILNRPTVVEEDHQIRRVPWLKGFIYVTAFALLEAGLILLSFHEQFHFIDGAWVLDRANWLSGFFGCVALALYVGRLQSKFLGPRSLLFIGLNFYIAIQPLYPLIGRDKEAAVWIMYFALILKGLLCFYMVQLFRSGDLLFYFVRVRSTYKKVKQQRKDFRRLLR